MKKHFLESEKNSYGEKIMGNLHHGLNSCEAFQIICSFFMIWSLLSASHLADLEPDLTQFLTIDAADWDWVAQEMGAEALREICASNEWGYGPEGVLTEMQAEEILIGVSIGLYYPPFVI